MPLDSIDIDLDREDLILLLLEANERLLGKEALSGVTRLEKLLFLLKNEADFEGIARFFVFEPHNFGPFSKEVYAAVDFLEGCELIQVRDKTYPSLYASSNEAKLASEISDEDEDVQATEKVFALTENGRKVATKLREAIGRRRPQDIKALEAIVLRYAAWPLNQLIRYVYRKFPEMTVKSVHPEAKRLLP